MAAEPAGPLPATPPGPAEPPTRPRLVYLVGHHRSGGTALGTIVASVPHVFFAGELYRFPTPIWTSADPNRGCSCGTAVVQCPFWREVRRRAEAEGLLGRLRQGQSRYERWRSLPRTLFEARLGRAGLRAHVVAMVRFLEIIAECSGTEVIVEYGASAARGRVYREARSVGLDVRYVHVVRDGRGFLLSELRTGPDPEAGAWMRNPLVIVARWGWMNLAAIALCGGDRAQYRQVRYEELLARPREVLAGIGRFADLDLGSAAERVEAGAEVEMRHVAAGNRNRLRGTLRLDREPARGAPLPWGARALFWMTAGWLAGLMGYRPTTRYRRPGQSG